MTPSERILGKLEDIGNRLTAIEKTQEIRCEEHARRLDEHQAEIEKLRAGRGLTLGLVALLLSAAGAIGGAAAVVAKLMLG